MRSLPATRTLIDRRRQIDPEAQDTLAITMAYGSILVFNEGKAEAKRLDRSSSSSVSYNAIKGKVCVLRHTPDAPLKSCLVVARFRPQNKVELASDGETIVDFQSDDTCSIQVGVKISAGAMSDNFNWIY